MTGGNRGIGRDVARQLAEKGYVVVLGSRDQKKGEQAARELDPGGRRIVPCHLDVTDPDVVRAAAGWIKDRFGRTDVLVNNAAIDYDTDQQAATADLDRVRRAMETNLYGAWAMVQALLPLLRNSSHPRIVNVSSESGSVSEMTGGTPAYSVSKAALNALTRLLAGELGRHRILVNAISPGWTATDMGGGGRAVAEGAASVVWGVLLPDDGPTGGFFHDGRPLPW
ncbi:MAG TPA: SDR family NAD(P)-dependent oxidoreductase [Kineosporiaceae bacterium]